MLGRLSCSFVTHIKHEHFLYLEMSRKYHKQHIYHKPTINLFASFLVIKTFNCHIFRRSDVRLQFRLVEDARYQPLGFGQIQL